MAEMTIVMQWLNKTCMQHDYALCAFAMPSGHMKQGILAGVEVWHDVITPISCFVQGRSLPIFTGGPPHSG